MSVKFSFKSIEICRLSQFERKVIPNGWRCDAKLNVSTAYVSVNVSTVYSAEFRFRF